MAKEIKVTCPVCKRSGKQYVGQGAVIATHLDLRPLQKAGIKLKALKRLMDNPDIEINGLKTCSGTGKPIK